VAATLFKHLKFTAAINNAGRFVAGLYLGVPDEI
jgi:hypothetical protein